MIREGLSPEAQRREIMRTFGITKDFATLLRELGPEEARWLVEHEFQTYSDWNERRKQWLLKEFGQVKLKRPRRAYRLSDIPVVRHSPDPTTGEKMA